MFTYVNVCADLGSPNEDKSAALVSSESFQKNFFPYIIQVLPLSSPLNLQTA